MYCEISGLVLEVQGGSAYLESRMAEYTLPLQQERERICDLGIFIQHGRDILIPEGTKITESGIWQLMRTDKGETVYRTFPEMEEVVSARMDFSENRADISVFSMEEEDIGQRDFLFSGQAFRQLILKKERMVLHGSCIAHSGRAILFSAPSGTGKSTHTSLWKQFYPDTVYVNDDTPVLRLDQPNQVLACGCPWSGKTHLHQNISVPLAAVVFLERGEKNQIFPMSKTEAMGRLLGECRKIPFQGAVLAAAALCGKLLEKTPVYRLTCDISREAVEVVRRELFL